MSVNSRLRKEFQYIFFPNAQPNSEELSLLFPLKAICWLCISGIYCIYVSFFNTRTSKQITAIKLLIEEAVFAS